MAVLFVDKQAIYKLSLFLKYDRRYNYICIIAHFRCTDGILFVVDSVDVERMEEAKMELMRTAKCPDNQVKSNITLDRKAPNYYI